MVFSNAKQLMKQEKTADLMPVISTLPKQLSVVAVQDTSVVGIGWLIIILLAVVGNLFVILQVRY